MNIDQILKQLGLDGKRAVVYLALLELGSASVNDIAKRAEIQRTTCYEILDRLVQDGFLSMMEKGRTRMYAAESPESLLASEEQKVRRLREALPELQSLFGATSSRPRVRLYEGVAGIKKVFEDTLQNKSKKLDGIISVLDIEQIIGADYFADYTARRVASGTRLQVIRSEATEVGEKYPSSTKENRVVHYAPRDMIFNLSFFLYDHRVAIIGTRRENFGMIIESEDFSQSLKHLFDVLWQVTRVGKKAD